MGVVTQDGRRRLRSDGLPMKSNPVPRWSTCEACREPVWTVDDVARLAGVWRDRRFRDECPETLNGHRP